MRPLRGARAPVLRLPPNPNSGSTRIADAAGERALGKAQTAVCRESNANGQLFFFVFRRMTAALASRRFGGLAPARFKACANTSFPLPALAARTCSSLNSIGAECCDGLRSLIPHHTYISTMDVLPLTSSSLKSTKLPAPFAWAARISRLVVLDRRSHLRQPNPATQAQALLSSLIAHSAVIFFPFCQATDSSLFSLSYLARSSYSELASKSGPTAGVTFLTPSSTLCPVRSGVAHQPGNAWSRSHHRSPL